MKVSPQLIPRAVLMRLRSLDLGGSNDYYLSSSAESSSTMVASAPESSNMYVIAYGDKEGLAPGERLELYGSTVRLIRTLAYGCPRGVTPESVMHGAIAEADLADITQQLDRMSEMYSELDLHGARHAGANQGTRTGTTTTPRASETPGSAARVKSSTDGSVAQAAMWDIVRRAGQQPAASKSSTATPKAAAELSFKELERQLALMRQSNREVIAAEWRRRERLPSLITQMNGETEDDLLVENGVCYACPEQAGLRVLRAARLAFMSMIERKANTRREAQQRNGGGGGGGEEARPLNVLDVSGIDFSFSHAAVQSTVELGMHDESQCRINFIPLNDAAARRTEGSMSTLVRQVVRAPGVAHEDPFALLSLRSSDVAAYTAYLDLTPPRSPSQAGSRQGRTSRGTASAAVQLARALATLRSGASMLASFVPTPRSAAAIYAEVCHGRRSEVAMETSTVAEAKACVASAISRCGRWGYITDEVLPMVDCPQGSAVSLIVTVL